MIPYSREQQSAVSTQSIKIIGLGGAGANMLERLSLDHLDGAELLAINTDARTLVASTLGQKIQIGANLTKGLGAGGDPELGYQAILESEREIRDSIRGTRILFLCVGLGGGTGSGAAPIIAKIAKEEGALVVIFATMPFSFEGRRRIEQAETALNQLSALSNALVIFDNNRMGELTLAEDGIHAAFAAGDKMISESIKAVIRLVIRPGLINVGLDDLMSSLRCTRSRCLFGSGVAEGEDRGSKALANALNSPLLDRGALLKQASDVLVHVSGGESLTLFEIEKLMKSLDQHIPKSAQILFGVAIDPAMGEQISITLISSLPEELLNQASRVTVKPQKQEPVALKPVELPPLMSHSELVEDHSNQISEISTSELTKVEVIASEAETPEFSNLDKTVIPTEASESSSVQDDELLPFAEIETIEVIDLEDTQSIKNDFMEEEDEVEKTLFSEIDQVKEPGIKPMVVLPVKNNLAEKSIFPTIKLDPKSKAPQKELFFDSHDKGRFEGGAPNLYEGEDLDLPPFLRKKST